MKLRQILKACTKNRHASFFVRFNALQKGLIYAQKNEGHIVFSERRTDMSKVKKAKCAYICYSVALIAIGLSLCAVPDISSRVVCILIGAFLMAVGAVKITNYFVNDVYGLAFQFDLAMGMINIILGVILILHPERVLQFTETLLGVLFMVDGNFKLQTAVEAKRFGLKEWWSILFTAMLTIICGLLLVFDPLESGLAMAIAIGISMAMDGILNLLVAVYAIRLVKRLYE